MAYYREDIVDIELSSGTVFRSFIPNVIGEGDEMANRFGVRLFRDGEPVNIGSGQCQGFFMAPNGTNILISGSSYTGVDANKAWVQLPQGCYTYEGQFALAIKLIGGGVTGTMRIVDGVVSDTGATGAVMPTSQVPTSAEIIAAYEDAVAVIDNSVRFDITQSLTTAEKERATANIGAAQAEDLSNLRSAVDDRSNSNIYSVVHFDTDGYYSAPNVITASVSYKCCEIVVPQNLRRFRVHFERTLDNQFYLIILLDKNKNVIGQIKGGTANKTYYLDIKHYPDAAYAQINDFGSYYYSSIEMIYRSILDSSDEAELLLSSKRIGEPVDCDFESGALIYADGTVAAEPTGDWLISDLILLSPGDELFVKCLGYLNTVSIITKCDANGENLIPLVISSGAAGEVKEYSYKSVGSEYVKICLNSTADWGIVKSCIERDVTGNIAHSGTIVYGYWCNNDGEFASLSYAAYIKLPIPEGATHLTVAYPDVWTIPEAVNDGYVGTAIFLDSQDDIILFDRPQNYANGFPCSGIYNATFPVPDDAAYFCMTTKLAAWNENSSIIIINGNKLNYAIRSNNKLNGVPFSDEELRAKLGNFESVVDNNDWSSLTWLLVGDSLTEKNIRAVTSYYDYIAMDTGINLLNKGHSGLGYKNGDWFYTALGQVTSSDFDICTFFGSGNDLYKLVGGTPVPYTDEEWSSALGNVTDTGTGTICGCINRTFDRFLELYPLKKFGVITPTPWNGWTNEDGTINGTHMDDYANALITICKNRGIPFLDLYHESGLRPWIESFRVEYYKENGVQDDGVHPNSKGHKWIYPMFMQFLKQFIVY